MKMKVINPYRKFHGAFIPNWLMKQEKVSLGAKTCYARLMQFAGDKGFCWPRHSTIAAELGVKERSVRNYISELVKLKLVVSMRRGLNKTNVYIFLHHSSMDCEVEWQDIANPDRKDDSEWQDIAALVRQNIATLERQDPAYKKNQLIESVEEREERRTKNEEACDSFSLKNDDVKDDGADAFWKWLHDWCLKEKVETALASSELDIESVDLARLILKHQCDHLDQEQYKTRQYDKVAAFLDGMNEWTLITYLFEVVFHDKVSEHKGVSATVTGNRPIKEFSKLRKCVHKALGDGNTIGAVYDKYVEWFLDQDFPASKTFLMLCKVETFQSYTLSLRERFSLVS